MTERERLEEIAEIIESVDKLRSELVEPSATETTDEQYRELATADYGSALVEIDLTATVHTFHAGSSKGAWVAAWVWIDEPRDTEEEKP